MRRGAIVRLGLAAVLSIGCASFPDQVKEASHGACEDVIARHAELVKDSSYSTELTPVEREKHETAVAFCYLDLRRPEQAVAMTTGWDKQGYGIDLVRARAAAQLGKESDCRQALASAVAKGLGDVPAVLLPPELGTYAGRDWFVKLAAQVWLLSEPTSAEEFAKDIARLNGQRLLPLKVASADSRRPSGELAVWVGTVRDSRIDRANGRTVLLADGVDTKDDLLAIEKTTHASGSDEEKRTYRDAFVPNGIRFVVRYGQVSERLVSVGTFLAFGRFAGRDPEGDLPVLDAFLIQTKQPVERTERVH